MTIIHHILHNIETDWRFLILFWIVVAHVSQFAAIGVFYPERIWKPRRIYLYHFKIRDTYIGGFEWVGFGYSSFLYDSQYHHALLLGFYYIHWTT